MLIISSDVDSPSYLLVCLLPDQHWLSHSRADQKKRQNSHRALLRRSPEDRLRADGKRFVPALPALGRLQSTPGQPCCWRHERMKSAVSRRREEKDVESCNWKAWAPPGGGTKSQRPKEGQIVQRTDTVFTPEHVHKTKRIPRNTTLLQTERDLHGWNFKEWAGTGWQDKRTRLNELAEWRIPGPNVQPHKPTIHLLSLQRCFMHKGCKMQLSHLINSVCKRKCVWEDVITTFKCYLPIISCRSRAGQIIRRKHQEKHKLICCSKKMYRMLLLLQKAF